MKDCWNCIWLQPLPLFSPKEDAIGVLMMLRLFLMQLKSDIVQLGRAEGEGEPAGGTTHLCH